MATSLYHDSIIIDALNISNWDSPAVFETLAASGVTAMNASLVCWENFVQTLDHVAGWRRRFDERSDQLLQVRTVADIHAAKAAGKVGAILGWQNATPIENDLDRIALFSSMGVRIIQLTFHERNLLGDGCWERGNAGLSNFGVDAVREMNRLGILIDLSHCGDRTTLDAIEVSSKPVACTHANSRRWCDHPRNKPDDALEALAARRGVIGATCFKPFMQGGMDATIDSYVDAIDDLVQRIGIEHVGIGTDFTQDQPQKFWDYIGAQQGTKLPSVFYKPTDRDENTIMSPKGLETPDQLPNLATALAEKGYRPDDIVKVLGGNWLRLFEEVWLG